MICYYILIKWILYKNYLKPGLEIVSNAVRNATKTSTLATKNSLSVTYLANN